MIEDLRLISLKQQTENGFGKVANDNTNPVITTYLEGLYGDYLAEKTIKTAVDLLMPDNLSDQFCFLTERAVHCLEFVEAKKYAI